MEQVESVLATETATHASFPQTFDFDLDGDKEQPLVCGDGVINTTVPTHQMFNENLKEECKPSIL